ncbi:MAG: hypothetical protein ACOCQH_00425 [Halanaerobiales bacterium]
MSQQIPGSELKVINIGIVDFAESLFAQNTEAVHYEWKPVQTDKEVKNMLDDLL